MNPSRRSALATYTESSDQYGIAFMQDKFLSFIGLMAIKVLFTKRFQRAENGL
jgi:hypothetical protein